MDKYCLGRAEGLTKWSLHALRPRQNCRQFADDIFKCVFLNENVWISLKISLKFVPKVRIDNIPALVQILACRRPGDKLLSEPVMVSLLTHTYVTRPQWVKYISLSFLVAVCNYVTKIRQSMCTKPGNTLSFSPKRTITVTESILAFSQETWNSLCISPSTALSYVCQIEGFSS